MEFGPADDHSARRPVRVPRAIDILLAGIAVAVLDLRVEGVDLLPDPFGYAACAWGLLAARREDFPGGWATGGAAAFVVAALLSIPDALFHEPPPPGVRLEPLDAMGLIASLAGSAFDLALLATTAGLATLAARAGADELARHATLAARAFGSLLALGLLVDLAWWLAGPEVVWIAALLLVLPHVVVFVAAIVILWRARGLAPRRADPAPVAPHSS